LLLFVCVFTQVPLQLVYGTAQDAVQFPLEQTCPDAQITPQAPQLLLSVWVFVQTPLHEFGVEPEQTTGVGVGVGLLVGVGVGVGAGVGVGVGVGLGMHTFVTHPKEVQFVLPL
jgi:hypothetical protein